MNEFLNNLVKDGKFPDVNTNVTLEDNTLIKSSIAVIITAIIIILLNKIAKAI